MAAPYAKIKEQDESTYLNSEQTINTFIASSAPCGPVGTRLVQNAKKFYKTYTPDNQYKSGYPVAFLNAEAVFDIESPVYFNRVLPDDALYGGAVVTLGANAETPNYSLTTGVSSPDDFIFADETHATTKEKVTVLCKEDIAGSLGGTFFLLPGEQEFVSIKTNATAEQIKLIANADVDNSLNNKYFILQGRDAYLWFNVDNAGVDPRNASLVLSAMTGYEVKIAKNATSDVVASAISTTMSAHTDKFTCSVTSAQITITRTSAGVVQHGSAGTSGFNYSISQIGLNASETVELAGKTGFEAIITPGAAANAVATAIKNALTANTNFTCAIAEDGVTLNLEAIKAGYLSDAIDGDMPTGFVFTTVSQGSSNAGSECMFFYAENPNSLDLTIDCYSHQDNPVKAPMEGTFVIVVKRDGIVEQEITCSRKKDLKDGNDYPLYVEVAMENSEYVRCINNEAIDENELPSSFTNLKIGGGTPGSDVTTGNMISAAKEWENKDDFDVTIMMVGGYTSVAYIRALDTIAKNRGDCCVINSIPANIENKADYLDAIINYRKNELNLNSSYTATFSSSLEVYNSGLNRNVYSPADGHVAGAIINASRNYEIFYPILGFKRGVLNNVLDVRRRFTKDDMDRLYDYQINPIRFVPGRGIVIWGQKTMQTQSSSLDRLNARLLLCSIKPQLQRFLEDNIGELNTDIVRDKITLMLNGLFDTIKAKQGITGYEVSCDPVDPTNPNKLTVTVRLAITPAIEFVDLTLVLTPAGVTFS